MDGGGFGDRGKAARARFLPFHVELTLHPDAPSTKDMIEAPTRESPEHRPPHAPSSRLRVPRPREVDGRRLASARSAFVVLVLALGLGTVLNAPGVHKSAYNQPPGWKRDAALAVTGPLATVSDALRLDTPRVAVQALIGRRGADDIDTDLGIEEVATPRVTPVPERKQGGAANVEKARSKEPKKVVFSPARPLRLWIAGDSLVITPGYAIKRAVAGNRAIVPVGNVEGRVATGLQRPDVFNWFREIRMQLASLKPKAVVLAFGGNDDKAFMTGLPGGVSIRSFGDAAWQKEYRRRVRAVFDMIERAGALAIWIGLPQTRSSAQTKRFAVVNAAVRAEVRERPGSVSYIDTYRAFVGARGEYAQYLSVPGHGQVKMRADDGVHFAPAGGDLIADDVVAALERAYDVRSWRRHDG